MNNQSTLKERIKSYKKQQKILKERIDREFFITEEQIEFIINNNL